MSGQVENPASPTLSRRSRWSEPFVTWWRERNDVTKGVIVVNIWLSTLLMGAILLVGLGGRDWPQRFQWWGALLAASLAGNALGWFIGAVLSPVDPTETARMSEFGKALTSIATGAGLLKAFEWAGKPTENLTTLPVVVGACLFVAQLALGVLTSYCFRAYFGRSQKDADKTAM